MSKGFSTADLAIIDEELGSHNYHRKGLLFKARYTQLAGARAIMWYNYYQLLLQLNQQLHCFEVQLYKTQA